jgi:hypothetical protein
MKLSRRVGLFQHFPEEKLSQFLQFLYAVFAYQLNDFAIGIVRFMLNALSEVEYPMVYVRFKVWKRVVRCIQFNLSPDFVKIGSEQGFQTLIFPKAGNSIIF